MRLGWWWGFANGSTLVRWDWLEWSVHGHDDDLRGIGVEKAGWLVSVMCGWSVYLYRFVE